MPYEAKEGSGALFPNDKQGNANRPDWRGDVMVGGVLYEVAGWAKQGQRGEFISLSAKPKEERREAPASSSRQYDEAHRPPAPTARPRPKDEAYRAASSPSSRRPSPDYDDIPF